MGIYAKAVTADKRRAQDQVVNLFLDKNDESSIPS